MAADTEAARPDRILLVRLGAVGDVIRTLPLLHALREHHPGARLGWVVEEPSAGLLREMGALDAVHVLPRDAMLDALCRPWRWPAAGARLWRFRAELRAARYELALDVHGTFKAALVARMAGADRLTGFGRGGSKEGAWRLYDEALPFPREPMSRIRRALLLGSEAGLLEAGAEDRLRPEHGLRLPPGRAAAARELVRRLPPPVAVLFPFASATPKGRRKRWPPPRWSELAVTLRDAGATVILAWGSSEELDEAKAMTAAADGAAVLAPRTDLPELAGLLEEADLLVTGDTGPMHLAAAVGTRCLALFGPSDPVVNRPWGEGHEVIVRDPLTTLAAGPVAEAAIGLLGLRGSTGPSAAEPARRPR